MHTATTRVFLIGLLITFTGCASHTRKLAGDEVAVAEQPRHTVFLIHGIGGNKSHFGAMEATLERALPALNPGVTFDAVPFEYDTKNPEKTATDFAKDLGQFIHEHYTRLGGITKHDKISLVMHSQGGLVGMFWMFHSFAGVKAFNPIYAEHVDAAITLGTPYWGAKSASFAASLKKLMGTLLDFLPFGDLQLRDLSLGSDTVMELHDHIVDKRFDPILGRMVQQIRPLNIAGVARSLDAFKTFASAGRHGYEDDSAVPLPTARLDFLEADATRENYPAGDFTASDVFKDFEIADYILVDALHLSPLPDNFFYQSVVQIPERCIDNRECRHPTLPYILRHLSRQPLQVEELQLKRMSSFFLYVTVRLPEGHGLKPEAIRLEFNPEHRKNSMTKVRRDVEVASPLQLYSRGAVLGRDPNIVRYYFTGSVSPSFLPPEKREKGSRKTFEDRELGFTIWAPGYKLRRVSAKVRATTTTFVKLNLERRETTPAQP